MLKEDLQNSKFWSWLAEEFWGFDGLEYTYMLILINLTSTDQLFIILIPLFPGRIGTLMIHFSSPRACSEPEWYRATWKLSRSCQSTPTWDRCRYPWEGWSWTSWSGFVWVSENKNDDNLHYLLPVRPRWHDILWHYMMTWHIMTECEICSGKSYYQDICLCTNINSKVRNLLSSRGT